MTISILLLVVFSGFLHAYWNYLAKTVPSGAVFVWLLAAVMSVILLPGVLVYLTIFGFDWTPENAAILFVTGLLHLLYFLVLQQGYRTSDLSVVYPLARGSGPVFSTFGAVLFLSETVTVWSLAGLATVVAGVLLVAGVAQRSGDRKKRRAGIFYGIATGLLIAGYTVWDGFAVKNRALAPILIEYASHPLRVAILSPVAWRNRPGLRTLWVAHHWKMIAIGAISPFAFILVLYAMKTAPVHYVAPMREISIVFGVIFGAKLLTEENFRPRLIGSLLILAGIVLLSVSIVFGVIFGAKLLTEENFRPRLIGSLLILAGIVLLSV